MSITDKAKELADVALAKAGKYSEKAAELSGTAREKAPGYVDKAADVAVKAVDAAAAGVDKATGGRFHEKLQGATAKVEESLDRPRRPNSAAPTVPPEEAQQPGGGSQAEKPIIPGAPDPDTPKP